MTTDWERKRNGEKFQMDVNQFFFREMEQMKQKQDDLVEALHTVMHRVDISHSLSCIDSNIIVIHVRPAIVVEFAASYA